MTLEPHPPATLDDEDHRLCLIDAQVHVVSANESTWTTDSRLRHEESVAGRQSFPSVSELLTEMDKAGVHAAVLVPPLSPGARADNRVAIRAAAQHPDRFCAMARVDHHPDERSLDAITRTLESRQAVGVRLSFHASRGNGAELLDGTLDWLWSLAEDAGFPIMLYAPGRCVDVLRLSRRHPDIRLILDHLALSTDEVHSNLHEAIAPLLLLAGQRSIAVKATGLPMVRDPSQMCRDWKRAIEEVVGAYGPDRVFWGSDLSRLPVDYVHLVDFFMSELDFLEPRELAQVLGGGIASWLGWHPCDRSAFRELTR